MEEDMERKTELDFVDEDIAEYFRTRFPFGEDAWREPFPTEMQHARNVKRLAKAIEDLTKLLTSEDILKIIAERLALQRAPESQWRKSEQG